MSAEAAPSAAGFGLFVAAGAGSRVYGWLERRAGGVYRLAEPGSAALGAVPGGIAAECAGPPAPFRVAAAAVGQLCVIAWKPLGITEQL
ncbi:hypothetical protein ACFWTE_29930 [Nocardiopsis sp. NPDC058631]|uniref:hypothetical protein n=1 Tax=Nocardiopsis sp. NPDC058631 TaxID=3346566 RepID=UPI00365EBDFB